MFTKHAEEIAKYIELKFPDIPVYVKIPCSLCGKEHAAMVIHGHISQPHMCEDCFRKLAEEWRRERKESVDYDPNNQ